MKNNLPKVTVVTVTYNAEKYLEATIKSVIEQDYPNIEYIIIDGASSDGTVDIIKKYEKHIAYWISESDSGIYDAMNKGIDKATGEWINFMNAGDSFSSQTVLTEIFYKDHDADVLYSDSYFVDINLKILGEQNAYRLEDFFTSKLPFIHQSTFVKKNILSIFSFSLDYKLASDFDLFFKLYIKGYKFKYLPNIKISKFLVGGLHTFNMIQYTSEALNSLLIEYSNTKMLLKDLIVVKSFKQYNAESLSLFPKILSLVLLNIELKIKPYNKILLYGYGSFGKVLYSHYMDRVVAIIDKSLTNKNMSLPIIKIEEIRKYDFDIIFISLINREDKVIADLVSNGVPKDKILFVDLQNLS